MRVLVGECVDLGETELPYAPIVGALRSVVQVFNEPELNRLFGAARGELARLLPKLGEPAPGFPGAAGQTRLFEMLLGVISRLGQERPVMLIIEDIHWADDASLDFLTFLVRNQRSERLATVLTFRSDEFSREHPVRGRINELERAGRAQRIELAPLLSARDSSSGCSGYPPPGERSSALRRSPGARSTIACSTRLRRSPGRELIRALREAVVQQVLVSDGLRYAFRHALLREAVYADLLPGQRAPLHAAIATTLTERPEFAEAPAGSAAEVAHHWYAAGELEPALAAASQAGAQAEAVYAIQEARRQYERVLELWDRVAEPACVTGLARSTVPARAADAEFLAGDEPRAVELARAALAETDLEHEAAGAARVEDRLATYLWAAGDSTGALEAARRAITRLGDGGPTIERSRALCAEGRMLVMRSENAEARPRLEESLAISRAIGASDEEAMALNYLGSALAFLGDYPAAIEHLRAAVVIAREAGTQVRGLSQYENLSEMLAETGQLDAARDVATEGIASARDLGMQRSYGLVLMGRGALCALALGRTAEAGKLT